MNANKFKKVATALIAMSLAYAAGCTVTGPGGIHGEFDPTHWFSACDLDERIKELIAAGQAPNVTPAQLAWYSAQIETLTKRKNELLDNDSSNKSVTGGAGKPAGSLGTGNLGGQF